MSILNKIGLGRFFIKKNIKKPASDDRLMSFSKKNGDVAETEEKSSIYDPHSKYPPDAGFRDSDHISSYKGGVPGTDESVSASPKGDNHIDGNLVMVLRPRSFEAEQFRILRTNLLFPGSGKAPRSIMVTSAVPGEGKSFISLNLAMSIAQNVDNKYALLIDCDMHSPCIHKRFGFGESPGLSEHLSKDVPLSSLLLKTAVSRLSILPGGKPPPNPSELLSSEKMSALLKDVQSRYNDRYTVIDSPPPKLTAETGVIAKQVDGVLLVVKYGSTPRKQVAELIDILGKDRILGIITNWADTRLTYRMYNKHIQRSSNY